jgi:hypothetical protein
MTTKYAAFVTNGSWAGFTTAESWNDMPLGLKGDIDHVIYFYGPDYNTEMLTPEEIDVLFNRLKATSQDVVAENNLWLAVLNVGTSIRRLSAATASVALRLFPRLNQLNLLRRHRM